LRSSPLNLTETVREAVSEKELDPAKVRRRAERLTKGLKGLVTKSRDGVP